MYQIIESIATVIFYFYTPFSSNLTDLVSSSIPVGSVSCVYNSGRRVRIEQEFRGSKGRGWLLRWIPARAHDNGLFLLFSNGVGIDDDEIRTGNAMIIDPYGRIITETWKADDDMVIADLDPSLLFETTGQRWIRTRRPELYKQLTEPTGLEMDTRSVRFDEKGV